MTWQGYFYTVAKLPQAENGQEKFIVVPGMCLSGHDPLWTRSVAMSDANKDPQAIIEEAHRLRNQAPPLPGCYKFEVYQ